MEFMNPLETFVRSFNNKVEPTVQKHLRNVYTCLTASSLVASGGAYVHLYTDLLQAGFLSTIVGIGLLLGLFATPDTGKNRQTRLALLMGFAFCTGLGLGPLVEMAIHIEPTILPTALLGTCLIFASFSGAALFAENGKFLYLGGTLLSVLNVMVLASLVNLFVGSAMVYQANLYIGLFVMCGFVLYDTQLIMEKRRRGDTDYIWHSVDLFIDAIGIFRRLLIILSQKENEGRKKRRD